MTDETPDLVRSEERVTAAAAATQQARASTIARLQEALPAWVQDFGRQIALNEPEHTAERGVQGFKDALKAFTVRTSSELGRTKPARLDPAKHYKNDKSLTPGAVDYALKQQVGWILADLAALARSEGYQVENPLHDSIRLGSEYLTLPDLDHTEWCAAENEYLAATRADGELKREHLKAQVQDMWNNDAE